MTKHPKELLLPFTENELAVEEHEIVAAHLADCESCRTKCRRLGVVRSRLGKLRIADTPEGIVERTLLLVRHDDRELRGRLASRSSLMGLMWVASCLLAVLGGVAIASNQSEAPVKVASPRAEQPMFLVLFLERPGAWPPTTPRSGYSDWFRALTRDARYESGVMLGADSGVLVTETGNESAANTTAGGGMIGMSGFIIIRARDYEDALRQVRRSPHLRYGTILVRRIG